VAIMMQKILAWAIVILALCFVVWRFWRILKDDKPGSACGAGCACGVAKSDASEEPCAGPADGDCGQAGGDT
jgi:hypothetical protein